MKKTSINFHWSRLGHILALTAFFVLGGLFLAACDVDSVDSTTAVLSDDAGTTYNFAGLYARADTNGVQQPLVFPLDRQSGRTLTWLRLLQAGSRIEAYDNAGMTWAGSISTIESGTANFSLRGRTTAGLSVEIAGALRYADQSSTMDAAWIEPAFSGSIFATATVSPSTTNTPSPTNTPTNVTFNLLSPMSAGQQLSIIQPPIQWRVARFANSHARLATLLPS